MFDFFEDEAELEFLNEIISSETKAESPKSAYTEIYILMKKYNLEKMDWRPSKPWYKPTK